MADIDVTNNSPFANHWPVTEPALFSIIILESKSLPVPPLNWTPLSVEFVVISGFVELLYACCSVVVDKPPVPPNNSPNLDVKVKTA